MTLWPLLKLTFAALVVATATGQLLRPLARSPQAVATLSNANLRIGAWWVLCIVVGLALALGNGAVIALFAVFSTLAFGELSAIAGAGGNRRELLGVFIVLTAAQYGLIWAGRFEALLIPIGALIYAFARSSPRILAALLLSIYCLSFVPALLTLDIRGYAGGNATLLFYFLLVVQSSDVFQYCWGKLLGRRRIAPRISPNKTWEGLIGGILTSTALGVALSGATPFRPWEAAAICFVINLAGFAGGLLMSAIKRHHGLKDFGSIVIGHGGVMDRLDSVCLSAPLFFFFVRYFYASL